MKPATCSFSSRKLSENTKQTSLISREVVFSSITFFAAALTLGGQVQAESLGELNHRSKLKIEESQALTQAKKKNKLIESKIKSIEQVPQFKLPALNNESLKARDEEKKKSALNKKGTAIQQFAEPFAVSLTPELSGSLEKVAPLVTKSLDQGEVTIQNELTIWRLRVTSEGAESLNLAFEEFFLPPSAELTIYSLEGDLLTKKKNFRSFTNTDNEDHGELWTPIIPSDNILIELQVDSSEFEQVKLALTKINHGYRKLGEGSTSGSCNVDVTCPDSAGWENEVRSVAAYTLNGRDTCSGAAINNTMRDGTPLFLTANHCGISDSNASSIVVYWNFENSTCRTPNGTASGRPGDGELDQFNTGATLLANHYDSDFALIQFDDAIKKEANVFLAGWNRTDESFPGVTGIHHPQVAEKRISFERDEATITQYLSSSPGKKTHIRVEDWDLGTTEPGSSGSPLFDRARRIIGQLHGGYAACGNDRADWYGRVFKSWTGGDTSDSRLKDWLDPAKSGQSAMNGDNINDLVQ